MKKENGNYIINDGQVIAFKELLEYFLKKRETTGVNIEETEFMKTEIGLVGLDYTLEEMSYKKLTGLEL